MNYERALLSTIRVELSRPTPVIHVLIGPRQVGKTTIARQVQESIGMRTVYATADSPVPMDSAWIETQWRLAVAEAAAAGPGEHARSRRDSSEGGRRPRAGARRRASRDGYMASAAWA